METDTDKFLFVDAPVSKKTRKYILKLLTKANRDLMKEMCNE